MLFLAHVLSLASGLLLSPVPPFGIPYPLMSAYPSPRPSFAQNSKLTSSSLPMDSNDCPTSICTSELCKEGTIRLHLYNFWYRLRFFGMCVSTVADPIIWNSYPYHVLHSIWSRLLLSAETCLCLWACFLMPWASVRGNIKLQLFCLYTNLVLCFNSGFVRRIKDAWIQTKEHYLPVKPFLNGLTYGCRWLVLSWWLVLQ